MNNFQADPNQVVEQLSIKIANLTRENAILNSIIEQYRRENDKLRKGTTKEKSS